jgi:pilus assembly protein CpaB
MIKSRTVLLIAVAGILGIVAAMLANRWAANRLAGGEEQPVVVAALEIPFGQKLEAAHVKVVPWPQASLPSGTFGTIAEIEGKIVNQRLVPGEPLLKDRVVETLEGSTLAAMVDPEKRAVTVRVNDVIGVAGFLLPGNRVDVLASRKQKDRAQTEILLEDLRVLAVDQIASPDKDKPVLVRAVTLEVTPKQAGKLVNATVEGTVQLALRNPAAKTARAAPAPRAPAMPRPVVANDEPSVTFIRGSKVELTDRKL